MLTLFSAALNKVMVLCSIAMLAADSPFANVVLQPVIGFMGFLADATSDRDAMQPTCGRKDSKTASRILATENATAAEDVTIQPIPIPSPAPKATTITRRRHAVDIPTMSLDLSAIEELPEPMLSPSVSECSSISSFSSIHTAEFDLRRRTSVTSVSRVESIVRQIEHGQVKPSAPLRARGHSMSENTVPIRQRVFNIKPTIGEWEKRIAKERHEKPLPLNIARHNRTYVCPTPSKSVPVTANRKDRL